MCVILDWTKAVKKMTVAFFLFLWLHSASSFLLYKDGSSYQGTQTHADITSQGIHRVAATFLTRKGYVSTKATEPEEILEQYFGSDTDNRQRFESRIREVSKYMHQVDQAKAIYTVNGERILEAHNYILSLRGQIKELQAKPLNEKTETILLEKIALALFTIQSFYSSTNWIEQQGNGYYHDFGVTGRDIMEISTPDEDTCYDCSISELPNDHSVCESNLMIKHKLTSGYLGGQDIVKPKRDPKSHSGKCSHGGLMDSTRFSPAIGGINKDTMDFRRSPHFHLHQAAAMAAVQATEMFLYANDSGILKSLSDVNFLRLLQLYSTAKAARSSLTFIMDTTGSMSNDIAGAVRTCIDMVTNVQGTTNEPANYVLATFNDPETLTTGFKTKNGNEMIAHLKLLRATGGGDCPEMAMSGILKGLQLSMNGSFLYVFTDATEKDDYRVNEVISNAQTMSVTISFLLTSESGCGIRKRRGNKKGRQKRSFSNFARIAVETGGEVYHASKTNVEEVMKRMIEKHIPSSEVIIDIFAMSSSDTEASFILDNDVLLTKIVIKGVTSTANIILKRPNGTVASFGGGHYSSYLVDGSIILSVPHPDPGNWTLTKRSNHQWLVNVTGASLIDMDYYLTEKDINGDIYDVIGSPIQGKNYTLILKLFNWDVNSSINDMALIDEKGYELMTVPLVLESNLTSTQTTAFGIFSMPSQNFYVQFQGTNKHGNPLRRMQWQIITPVNVQLLVKPLSGTLTVGESHNLTFMVSNAGSTQLTLVVSLTEDQDTTSNGTEKVYTLDAESTVEDVFQIIGHTNLETVIYTISVKKRNSTITLQRVSVTGLFAYPGCEILSLEGSVCPVSIKSNDRCDAYHWKGTAMFSKNVTTIYTSPPTPIISLITNGQVITNISGTCCAPSVFLNGVYENDLAGQCHFDFGTIPVKEIRDTTTTEPETTTTMIPSTEATTSMIPNSIATKMIIPSSNGATTILMSSEVISNLMSSSEIITTEVKMGSNEVNMSITASPKEEKINKDFDSALAGEVAGGILAGLILLMLSIILYCKKRRHREVTIELRKY